MDPSFVTGPPSHFLRHVHHHFILREAFCRTHKASAGSFSVTHLESWSLLLTVLPREEVSCSPRDSCCVLCLGSRSLVHKASAKPVSVSGWHLLLACRGQLFPVLLPICQGFYCGCRTWSAPSPQVLAQEPQGASAFDLLPRVQCCPQPGHSHVTCCHLHTCLLSEGLLHSTWSALRGRWLGT